MMKKLKKQTLLRFAEGLDGELVNLPLQVLMQTIFLGGNKGSGKTSAMKRLFEAAHIAGAQCGAIAPLGKWWSLRISHNGRGPGLKRLVIFGGRFGDVPLNAGSGRVIARIVVQKRLHFVLDVEMMRKTERAVFLADFMEELIQLKKAESSPSSFVLFCDEAQAIAPQKSTSKEVEKLRELMGDFARECRNYGAGLVLSAQRSANVDKDLLALCEMLVVMRTVHHLDRNVYKHWVDEKGGEDEDDGAWLRKLRRLTKGEAYIYAPELNVFERAKVFLPNTYDATATATLGEKTAKVGRLGKLDVKRLSAELSELVTEAAASDPRALREENEKLKQLVKQHELGRGVQRMNKSDERIGALNDQLEALKKKLVEVRKAKAATLMACVTKVTRSIDRFVGINKVLDQERQDMNKLLGQWQLQVEAFKGVLQLAVGTAPKSFSDFTAKLTPDAPLPKRVMPSRETVSSTAEDFKLVGKMTDMLAALNGGPLSRDDLATVVGMAPGSGGFNNYIGSLKTAALVRANSEGNLGLTAEGMKVAPSDRLFYSRGLNDVVSRHGSAIVGKMKKMVEVVSGWHEPVDRDQLADAVGMARGSGGFNNYVGALSGRGILVKNGRGYVINPVLSAT